jgi:membrane-associated protease RseP (regulator of RpoE activity)
MRWAKLLSVGVLAIGILTPALSAQEEGEERQECVCPEAFRFYMGSAGENWPQVTWFGNRARLGVEVNTKANAETDRYGALIESVWPGGPAARAGIEAGDIITKLDGESLLSGSEAYDEGESAPGMRLVERVRNLEHGDTVEVELRRDGKTQTVEVVAGEFGPGFGFSFRDSIGGWSFDDSLLGKSARMRDLAVRLRELPEIQVRGPETFALRLGARLPGLELVSLNPQLGEYFGTEEGVLVVAIPQESELGLEAGDVIKRIDGREVKNPSHAMRILRSYDADEEVTFEIIRKGDSRTVTGRVPEPLDADSWTVIEKEKGNE